MHVAPFSHWPTQSSISFAHVKPLHPSKQVHVNEPGVFVHNSAFMHGPSTDDVFASHSLTSIIHSICVMHTVETERERRQNSFSLVGFSLTETQYFEWIVTTKTDYIYTHRFGISHPSIPVSIRNEIRQRGQYNFHHSHTGRLNTHQYLLLLMVFVMWIIMKIKRKNVAKYI